MTRLQDDDSLSVLGNTLFCLLRSVTSVLELATPCSVVTGGEGDHYSPSSTEVNNECGNTSSPTYTIMLCKVINFSLLCYIVGLLPLQESITAVYSESNEDSLYCPHSFFKIHFNIILQYIRKYLKLSFRLCFPSKILYVFLTSPTRNKTTG